MKVDNVQPSFGMSMIVKDPKSVDKFIFENFSAKDSVIYRYLQKDNSTCNVDMYLSVVKNHGKNKLQAEVGGKQFVSGFLTSPIRALKKATKYALKIEAKNTKLKEANEIINPRLK